MRKYQGPKLCVRFRYVGEIFQQELCLNLRSSKESSDSPLALKHGHSGKRAKRFAVHTCIGPTCSQYIEAVAYGAPL